MRLLHTLSGTVKKPDSGSSASSTILEGAPLADSSALVNLAPSSTGSRLVLDELGGALMYSLIQSKSLGRHFSRWGTTLT